MTYSLSLKELNLQNFADVNTINVGSEDLAELEKRFEKLN